VIAHPFVPFSLPAGRHRRDPSNEESFGSSSPVPESSFVVFGPPDEADRRLEAENKAP
jgi:hypothetical protein